MQIIQNRVTAATPEEAVAMIYAKHNPIKLPREGVRKKATRPFRMPS